MDLVLEGSRVMLTVKNISAAPLNITASDLMERSVRGDDSRNTEGSGLGLSIAGDLAELMKGDFHVEMTATCSRRCSPCREFSARPSRRSRRTLKMMKP